MSFTKLILPAAAALALALTTQVARADDAPKGDGKCKLAIKGDSPTAKACTEGGQKAAAKKMKELVKAAKAKGVKFVCDDCHDNIDDYKLTKNAEADFKKLLDAAK